MWKRLRPPGRAAARYFAPRATWRTLFRARRGKAEPACKPGSVEDSHSSRRRVTTPLQRSTRTHRGQRHCVPIRPCSGWGLPCPVALAPRAVRSYRTVSPLPRIPRHRSGSRTVRRSALCCTGRRLTPPRCYLASCPVEPGLSSPVQAPQRLSGRLRVRILRLHRRIPQDLPRDPWARIHFPTSVLHIPCAPETRMALAPGADYGP